MSEALSVFVKLLFLVFSLAVVGEPLRILLSRFSSLMKKLDAISSAVLDVYLGALIFYVIALVPLPFFNATTTTVIALASLGFSAFHYRRNLTHLMEKSKNLRVNDVFIWTVVLSMFLATLWLGIVPRTEFVLGSVHDEALHSLFATLVIEHQFIPERMEPYLPQPLVYSQAHTVVNVYASYILGYTAPRAILFSTALFVALSVLGAYFLGSLLNGKVVGVSFAFVLSFVSNWPKRVTWGANALTYGFAPFLICLGCLVYLLKSGKKGMRDVAVVGFLFGYLAASYLPFYQALISSLAVLLVITLRKRQDIIRSVKTFLLTLISGTPLFAVPVYRFLKWYPALKSPLRETSPSLWSDVFRNFSISEDNWFNWHPLLTAELLVLIVISAIAIVAVALLRKDRLSAINESIKVILSSLIGVTIFPAMASLIPLASRITNIEALMVAGILSLCLLVGAFNALLSLNLISSFRSDTLSRFALPSLRRVGFPQIGPCLRKIVVLFFLLATAAPFVYYTVFYDSQMILNSSVFNVTNQDDYDLMVWIGHNVPKDAVVLINYFDSGNFVPSVSHRKAIYPFHSIGRYDSDYQRLLILISDRNLNSTTLGIMKNLNVDYVFVGSKVTYWWAGYTSWDPQLFLNHPNFELVRNIRGSYVFAFSY